MEMIEKNHFWFVAKRKFLQIILNRYAPQKNLRILDVGCGAGAILDFLREKGYVGEGIDNNEEALKYCRDKGLRVDIGTVEKMNYKDGSFDVVLASDVLEHLTDDRAAVKEIARVLKKGGFFIATVPAHHWLWSYHDVALHHQRRYSRHEWEKLLSSQFEIRLVTWLHLCIILPIWIMRRVGKKSNGQSSGSDVREVNQIINILMKVCYWPELTLFKIISRLPWGVSLLAVVKKK